MSVSKDLSSSEKRPRQSRLTKILHKRLRKRCCCCIPIKPGIMTIAILLLIHGVWYTAVMASGIEIYTTHISRGITVFIGVLYFLVVIVAIYGIYVTSRILRKKDDEINDGDRHRMRRFSWKYSFSIVLLLTLHLAQLILAFRWKGDTMSNCQNDLRYMVPSNSSTATVSYDPNAVTIQEVIDACGIATNLSLAFYLFDYFVFKFIILVHFAVVVHLYSDMLNGKINESGDKVDETNVGDSNVGDSNVGDSNVDNADTDKVDIGKVDGEANDKDEDESNEGSESKSKKQSKLKSIFTRKQKS